MNYELSIVFIILNKVYPLSNDKHNTQNSANNKNIFTERKHLKKLILC